MTSPAEFLPEFAECSNHREANDVYKNCVRDLQEALRLTHRRIVDHRDNPIPTTTRQRRDNSDVHDMTIKSWARLTGVVMPPSGRVTNALRDAWRRAHSETSEVTEGEWGPLAKDDAESPQELSSVAENGPQIPLMVTDDTIREWANAQGIEFQRVSKNLRVRYAETHQNRDQVQS
jgi:hypothetical protein